MACTHRRSKFAKIHPRSMPKSRNAKRLATVRLITVPNAELTLVNQKSTKTGVFINRTVYTMSQGAKFSTKLEVQAKVCGGAERMVETLACAEHRVATKTTGREFEAPNLTHDYILVDFI